MSTRAGSSFAAAPRVDITAPLSAKSKARPHNGTLCQCKYRTQTETKFCDTRTHAHVQTHQRNVSSTDRGSHHGSLEELDLLAFTIVGGWTRCSGLADHFQDIWNSHRFGEKWKVFDNSQEKLLDYFQRASSTSGSLTYFSKAYSV